MKHRYVRNTALSGIFIALALILPFLTGQLPEIGNMLLPMHLPVMLAGLICGAPWGAAVGFISPLLRSLIFGAPMLFPRAVAMAPELAVYGLVIGLIFSASKAKSLLSLYIALVSSMIAGRAIWGIVMACLLGLSKFTLAVFWAEAFANAIPGIILQLVLIPSIMLLLKRARIVAEPKPDTSTDGTEHIPPDLLAEIFETREEGKLFVIAIDGRCCAGKTTLATALSKKLGAPVFHIDDFFLPPEMRTEERMNEAGGNFDRERFISEILKPLTKGQIIRYRKYDCKKHLFLRGRRTPYSSTVIIEGSYALHPELRPYESLKIFVDIDSETQRERVIAREGEEGSAVFFEKWIPLEEKYIKELEVIDACDKIIFKNS